MTNLNITLPEPMRHFVEEQVSSGAYRTASEYIRTLIRKDQKRKAQERLEALLLEGLDSGDPMEATPEFWQDLRGRIDARRKAKQAAKYVKAVETVLVLLDFTIRSPYNLNT